MEAAEAVPGVANALKANIADLSNCRQGQCATPVRLHASGVDSNALVTITPGVNTWTDGVTEE